MNKLLVAWNKLEEGVLVFCLLGLALMAFVEVVTRYIFGHSFTWFEELARYMGVFITFLGASLGVKYGMHFSMDFVVGKVPVRVALGMRAVGGLISGVLFLTISWLAWRHAMKLAGFGVTSAAMGLPMVYAYLPIAFFGFTMSLRFLREGWVYGLGAWRGRPPAGARLPQKEAGEAQP